MQGINLPEVVFWAATFSFVYSINSYLVPLVGPVGAIAINGLVMLGAKVWHYSTLRK